MLKPRHCLECQGPIPESKPAIAKFCSDRCRYKHRDSKPEKQALDAERHRARYQNDPAAHDTILERQAERYRTDPEFRARAIKRATARYHQKKHS